MQPIHESIYTVIKQHVMETVKQEKLTEKKFSL